MILGIDEACSCTWAVEFQVPSSKFTVKLRLDLKRMSRERSDRATTVRIAAWCTHRGAGTCRGGGHSYRWNSAPPSRPRSFTLRNVPVSYAHGFRDASPLGRSAGRDRASRKYSGLFRSSYLRAHKWLPETLVRRHRNAREGWPDISGD